MIAALSAKGDTFWIGQVMEETPLNQRGMFRINWFEHADETCPCAETPGGLGKDFECVYHSFEAESGEASQAWMSSVLTIVSPESFLLTREEDNSEKLLMKPETVTMLRGMVKHEENKKLDLQQGVPPPVEAEPASLTKLQSLQRDAGLLFRLLQPAMRTVRVRGHKNPGLPFGMGQRAGSFLFLETPKSRNDLRDDGRMRGNERGGKYFPRPIPELVKQHEAIGSSTRAFRS